MSKDNSALVKLLSDPEGASKPDGKDSAAPQGAPMSTPQAAEGDQAEADVKISLALDLLGQALPAYGSESDKGTALLDMISKGSKTFGVKMDASRKMIPAELKMLMSAADMKTPEQTAGAAPGGAAPMPMSGAGGAASPMKMAA